MVIPDFFIRKLEEGNSYSLPDFQKAGENDFGRFSCFSQRIQASLMLVETAGFSPVEQKTIRPKAVDPLEYDLNHSQRTDFLRFFGYNYKIMC